MPRQAPLPYHLRTRTALYVPATAEQLEKVEPLTVHSMTAPVPDTYMYMAPPSCNAEHTHSSASCSKHVGAVAVHTRETAACTLRIPTLVARAHATHPSQTLRPFHSAYCATIILRRDAPPPLPTHHTPLPVQ